MSFFVCLVRPSGGAVTAEDRNAVIRLLESRGLDGHSGWHEAGSLSALVSRPGEFGPRLARVGTSVAVGDVRLDNPQEIATQLPEQATPETHLELALRTTRAHGSDAVADLLGDFAFVTWDAASRQLLAARDTFGVKPLFYSNLSSDLIAFSSHASLLGFRGEVSEEYIAKTFVRSVSAEDTIFASVEAFPAAHTSIVADGRWSRRRYWSADRFETDPRYSGPDAVEELRTVFADSVRLRLSGQGPVWSELSGGLDTSSIVSMGSWLLRSGAVQRSIAGTVTYSDSLGAGDESEFVEAVVQGSGVANEQVRDSWPWQDDGGQPFRTEMPGPATMFWARNRQRDEILRKAGAEVLLSGLGGDHVLEGNLHFFADGLAAGAVGRTLREMAHWAALQQKSFWKLGFRHALVPLLPSSARSRLAWRRSDLRVPDWVAPDFRKRFDLDAKLRRGSVRRVTQGPLPRYRSGNVVDVQFLARTLPRPHPGVTYERRYPFLYRPLVELTLQLPPQLKVHPHFRKVALRKALRGVLPELVRTRPGKGGVGARMLWALNHERRLIEQMLRDPLLAQMGYVDPARLRTAYDEARTGKRQLTVPLFITLGLETWLSIEHGRWPRYERGDHSVFISTLKESNDYAEDQTTVREAGDH